MNATGNRIELIKQAWNRQQAKREQAKRELMEQKRNALHFQDVMETFNQNCSAMPNMRNINNRIALLLD